MIIMINKIEGFQSLFYWITYSYMEGVKLEQEFSAEGFNPYFTGLPILMNIINY